MNMDEAKLKHFCDVIYRFALINLKNRADAEDVCQETMYRYLKKKPVFHEESQALAWFYKTAVNLCHDLGKNSWYKRRAAIDIDELDLPDEEAGNASELLDAVHALPMKYSEVIILYYYQGYSAREIGDILGKKEGTVYSLLNRARKLLEKNMKEDLK